MTAPAFVERMPVLMYDAETRTFMWFGEFKHKEHPKRAGFRWNENAKAWWTRDFDKAAKLVEYGNDDCQRVLAGMAPERAANLDASRATDSDLEIPCPPNLAYMPFQRGGIAYGLARFQHLYETEQTGGVLIADEMGLGKAQPLDAKVLTPTGWARMGDMQVGQMVVASDGSPARVTGVYPQGVKDIYRVTFSDGSTTECCDDHLWQVNTALRKWQGLQPRVKALSEIRQRLKNASGNRLHFVPMVQPVAFAASEPPLDPYLLGLLLGDGGIAHRVLFSTEDAELIDSIRAVLPEDVEIRHASGPDWRIASAHSGAPNSVMTALRSLGLFGKRSEAKFIPEVYKLAPVAKREAMLQGLLDTDGHVRPNDNNVEFTTVSKTLAKDVQFIVQSLGGTAPIREKPTPGQLAYRMSIALPDHVSPFRLARKAEAYHPRRKYQPARAIEAVEYVGSKEAQCIAVDAPDHLYVTDDFILTHNTVQAIGLINADATIRRVLVVCPASLKINWRRELERWLTRSLWVQIVGEHWSMSDGVRIVNYDVLHKHARAIAAWRPDIVIADEAHMAKNPNARRSKALYAIEAERLVYLTGTPIVNRPAELWPLISHLAPDAFPDERDYMNKYRFSEATSRRGQGVLYALQQKLRASCMVRRLKKDVLTDLPPKRRQVIELPAATAGDAIANEQAAVSKFIAGMTELRLRVELAKASEEPADYAAAVKALKEGASAWFGEISKLRHETALAKVPAVVGHIKEVLDEGNKVVLFAHHHDVIESFMEAFPKVSVKLTGQMAQLERQRSVDLFQRDPKVLLFVGSIQAAGVGLTLTASSHAVFAELDWVPGNMSQAEDRTHRIGQVNSVLVQHLVLEGSLDATMAKTLVSKQEVIDAALDNEAGELAEQPIVPIEETHASANLTRARLERDAAGMGLAERLRVHRVMQDLAGTDGLNLIDARIAAEFAAYAGLTPRQAALGQRIAQKYGRE